ncbi:hypothetical protein ACVGOW_25475 [Pseudonocardia saturnea]
MLRASHRVLRPGGRIAYYTIHIPPGLSDRERRRGARAGPPAVASSSAYPRLLRSARFVEMVEVDVTAAYLDTARAWLRHGHRSAEQLATLAPPGEFVESLARRRIALAAIESGLLRGSLFLGARPT